MWRRLKNFVLTLETYSDLSPDTRLRSQINHHLEQRPSHDLDEWFIAFWKPHGISRAVAAFVYQNFSLYSGLPFARVRPDDKLEADLCWTQVCWFDWEISLFEDFYSTFSLDISDRFDYDRLITVADIVAFLNDQVLTLESY
jgi:hypothetical protein